MNYYFSEAIMEISKEARDRIFTAANSLYEQAGRAGNFPTVDSVRKLAKVNMNDASVGMKEWRRTQTTQVAPVEVLVPEAVQHASAVAVATLWHEAQELANESLRVAQAGWDAERTEAETLNKQIGDAYETLSVNFDTAQLDAANVRASLEQSEAEVRELQVGLETTSVALTAAAAATVTAEARAMEIKLRADELRAELDHAHQEAAQVRDELAALRKTHQAEVEALRAAAAAQQARADDAMVKADAASAAIRAELAAATAKAEDAASSAASAMDALRIDLATVRAKAEAAQEALRQERSQAAAELERLVQQLGQAKVERDQAAQATNQAREEAATLRGRMDAITAQNLQLIQTLKTSPGK
jgi:colicin import membrane protein